MEDLVSKMDTEVKRLIAYTKEIIDRRPNDEIAHQMQNYVKRELMRAREILVLINGKYDSEISRKAIEDIDRFLLGRKAA